MMLNYLPATRRIPWARTLRRESSGSGSDSWCGLVKAESSNIVQEGRKEVWSVMTVFVFVWLWHKLTNQKEKTQKGRPMTRLSFIMVQKRWLRWLSLFFDAESNRAAHKCTTTLTQKGQPMTRLSFSMQETTSWPSDGWSKIDLRVQMWDRRANQWQGCLPLL